MALDAAFYPHVLDAVLAHAPWDALPALRGVSKALLARVSEITYAHVAVRIDHAADGDSAAIAILDPYTLRRIPGLRFDASRELDHRLTVARLARYTVTLDVLDEDGEQLAPVQQWVFRRLRACFANVKMLRCTSPFGLLVARSPDTVVFFFRFDGAESTRPCPYDILEWPLEKLVVRLEIPPDTQPDVGGRFADDCSGTTPIYDGIFALRTVLLPNNPTESVVLVSQGRDAPPRYSTPLDHRTPFRHVLALIETFMGRCRKLRVVGLETVDPALMGIEVTAHHDDAHNRIAAVCAAVREMLARPRCPAAYLQVLLECATAVTLEDYRRTVEADEWALLNTWPGTGLPMPSSWARASA